MHRDPGLPGSGGPRPASPRRCPRAIGAIAGALAGFLFPDSCLHCGASVERERRHLCARCWRHVVPVCRAVRLPDGSGEADPDRTLAYCLLPFEGAPRALIHALKYGRRTSVARVLAEIAAPAVHADVLRAVDVIVPVPLHAVRLRERGFNQAALLGRRLATLTGKPTSGRLRRARPTVEQAGLSRARRLENVAGAFVSEPGSFDHARVLLLDDVVTTGATLAAAAAALVAAGAPSVVCLAVAGRIRSTEAPAHRGAGETG